MKNPRFWGKATCTGRKFLYDRCGRMIEQTLSKPSRRLFRRKYQYDAEGNLIELKDSEKGVNRFAYDSIERLSEVWDPKIGIEQFVYDSTGNLLRRGNREFSYARTDLLTKTNESTLTYDKTGNLIEKRTGGSVIRYSYDTDNQLVAVESNGSGRIEFTYDAFGRRVAKKSKECSVGFLWDGDILLAEQRDERSNEYIFDPDSYSPLCRFDEQGFANYHNDHLGTPRELTDGKGMIIWSATYDAYGQISQLNSNFVENQIRFQGQYEDAEVGLHYNFYRYFDPENGKYAKILSGYLAA